jgi:hypothetical protein
LEQNGLYAALALLTSAFRNPAAHIDELSDKDYFGCRELVVGPDGLLWKLVLATEQR